MQDVYICARSAWERLLTLFWIVAALVTLAAIAVLARPLLRPAAGARSRAAHDAQVFRDQLAELDRDVRRGVITEAEAASARVEISRHLLAAAAEVERAEGPGPAPRRTSRALAILLVITAPLGATGLYVAIASPGYPDRPLAERLAEARQPTTQARVEELVAAEGYDPEASALEADPSLNEFIPLVTRLQQTVADRPNDLQGARLLAGSLRRLGRYSDSWRAYARVIELAGDSATLEDYSAQVETMIFATAGFVSDDALAVADAAAGRFGPNGMSQYVSGMHAAQRGDVDAARESWNAVIAMEPGGSPFAQAARRQLVALGSSAEQAPAAGAPGPSAEDMEAAAAMSAADRQAMIEGMVEGLSDRLRSEGGEVDEWARLIRALSVLGRSQDAATAYEEAAATFAGDPTALAFLKEQALLAGLAIE